MQGCALLEPAGAVFVSFTCLIQSEKINKINIGIKNINFTC
jgi:hypothetical protein